MTEYLLDKVVTVSECQEQDQDQDPLPRLTASAIAAILRWLLRTNLTFSKPHSSIATLLYSQSPPHSLSTISLRTPEEDSMDRFIVDPPQPSDVLEKGSSMWYIQMNPVPCLLPCRLVSTHRENPKDPYFTVDIDTEEGKDGGGGTMETSANRET